MDSLHIGHFLSSNRQSRDEGYIELYCCCSGNYCSWSYGVVGYLGEEMVRWAYQGN